MYLNFHLQHFEGYQKQCLDSSMQSVYMIINVMLLSALIDQNPWKTTCTVLMTFDTEWNAFVRLKQIKCVFSACLWMNGAQIPNASRG